METNDYKSLHSIRVNHRLIDICEKTGLPLSNIIESCLVYFATLNDRDRIKFLVNNDPYKIDYSSFVEPSFNYADRAIAEAKQQLGSNKSLSRISVKALIALGLVLLASMLFSLNKEKGGE